jgi:membrane-associated phospholipid phosphatase
MSNQLVVDVAEDTKAVISSPTSIYIRLARCISTILAPVTVSVPMVILVALYHTRNLLAALLYAAITLLFLTLGPLVYILLGVRTGKLSDMDVSRRTERAGPFLFSIISIMLGLFILVSLHGPRNLVTALLVTEMSAMVLMATTWWWKISVHAATLAGTVTMLVALYGVIMLPAFVLLVLVSWSRVALRRHTVAQVVMGSLVSIVLTTVIILLRGV